ncbi:Fic family protein [Curtanaerobium respiraculi]|uniref:Fic family protein n=1 Tax=Curtanaerobium respiraculi TaxID=2949669 RepID=UPI0024B38206|nr:Fic family protein [Curtanaerobium respiraculi]
MRTFDYSRLPEELLAPDIANMVSAIHEYKGKQELYLKAKPDALNRLCEVAKIQSTASSNRIEGISTTGKRLMELMSRKAEPRNRNEEEIAGYRDVLATIHESYDHIPVRPSVILQLHRDLYWHADAAHAGSWKDSDNVIAERGEDGVLRTRFQPMPAVSTPAAMDGICETLNKAMDAGIYDPLLLMPVFVLDFLCVHPFNDGNGRISRLLTLLLLYKAGYLVGKFVSVEMAIEKSKDTYYEALQASSSGWTEGASSYVPFARYMLGTVLACYRDFEDRVRGLTASRMSKADRVAAVLDRHVGKVTKADILAECPDISATTVERALADLVKSGAVEKVGGGRGTAYVRR